MFTPLYIQLKYWFYPTGNTPAVNLLRDTPAAAIDQQDTISALLLACGDPRNVLFSLWNRQGSGRFTYCIAYYSNYPFQGSSKWPFLSRVQENGLVY